MSDVIKLLQHAQMPLENTTLRRLSIIVIAMFTMTGRVTMRGIARWTGKGGKLPDHSTVFQHSYPLGTGDVVSSLVSRPEPR